jgi:membrane-associated phospholipid phosphatase
MVGLVLLAALWFRARPEQVFLDNWGFSFVHPELDNTWWQDLTDLKSVSVVAAGSILAAVTVVTRDRWRALACLVAPVLAVVLTEYFLKPGVHRHYDGVISFPSGTTTAVSALAMAWVVAVPGRLRPVIAVVGAFLVGLECMAVVGLQWHFPTDALGGAVFGAGVVLLVDGALHLSVGTARRRQARARQPAGRATPA